MNQEEFKYHVYRAGLGDHYHDILDIVLSVDDTPNPLECFYDAAYRYLCVNTNWQKVGGFLRHCDNLSRQHCISWDEAVTFVCLIIAGWA
jgi:hypothetical protein